ncbi:MAG: DUF485 domain-containing protein [Verrucomicrobiota bacterium]
MQKPSSASSDIHSEEFLRLLMRRQFVLSLGCAAAFLVVLLGLPLANYFFPELMAKRVFGFTLTWFVLGISFFPAVWGIAYFFIHRSIELEEAEVRLVKPEAAAAPAAAPVSSRPAASSAAS